jgi:hypothetical protein
MPTHLSLLSLSSTPGSPSIDPLAASLNELVAQGVAQACVRLPADQRRALVDRVEPEDHAHGGGLPRAVGTDEAGHAPWGDLEREPVQGEGLPETLANTVDFDR